ncbi:MAG: tyrosine-protein phosphatase [Acutalibacteraceae bacterium]|nr:tyrosine-protein phosphatase [Acutalibacteraceae bacterium]
MIQSTFALKNSIGLTGVRNARELGGYRTSDGRVVRHGCLLRTGKLENMTDADRDRLLGTYHLKKIIDLRSPGEISRSPEPVLPGTEYINSAPLGSIFRCYVPAIDCRTPEGRNYLRSIFRSLLQLDRKGDLMKNYYTAGYNQICTTQQGIEACRIFFRQLLEADGDTVLWHCSDGKDRTGSAALLLLLALGVDRETAIQDYLLSNDYLADLIQEGYDKTLQKFRNPQVAADLASYRGVQRVWIEESFRAMERNFGTPDAFLRNAIGLTDSDFSKLRAAYTESCGSSA